MKSFGSVLNFRFTYMLQLSDCNFGLLSYFEGRCQELQYKVISMLGPHVELLTYKQGLWNHFQTFYIAFSTELTFNEATLNSSLVHAPIFLFLTFSWGCVLDSFLTLEIVFNRTNLDQCHPWSIFQAINCKNGHSKLLLFA